MEWVRGKETSKIESAGLFKLIEIDWSNLDWLIIKGELNRIIDSERSSYKNKS